MNLPPNKTKIVCTIGPASESQEMMERMLLAGMNVARLNFSHGDFSGHGRVIENLRAAARSTGRRLAILADLPGPKMRIGKLDKEPLELRPGDNFTLTLTFYESGVIKDITGWTVWFTIKQYQDDLDVAAVLQQRTSPIRLRRRPLLNYNEVVVAALYHGLQTAFVPMVLQSIVRFREHLFLNEISFGKPDGRYLRR